MILGFGSSTDNRDCLIRVKCMTHMWVLECRPVCACACACERVPACTTEGRKALEMDLVNESVAATSNVLGF